MRALRTAVALVLALALPAPVLAADFQAGSEAYIRGDYAAALKEWKPLAEQGQIAAQIALGFMYGFGRGITQDHALAAKWYEAAAVQGHVHAQLLIAIMYQDGRGITQDYVLAHMWFNLAVARLLPGEDRDMAVSNRDQIEKLMTPEQIAEAQRVAREWKPK